MAAKKLNQVLATEKMLKGARENEFTELYRGVQKVELVKGLRKVYVPKAEDGEKIPPEAQKVQIRVEDALTRTVTLLKEVFNVTAVKDATNCVAKADVVIDGEVLLKDIPATHLLWLEKRLQTLADFIKHLPTLPLDTSWTYDEAQGLYQSEPQTSLRTKKIEEFKVVIQPTKEHPGQYVKVTVDDPVGAYTTIYLSGAIPPARKQQLQERVEKFSRAVKEAREEANRTDVVELSTSVILDRLFAP